MSAKNIAVFNGSPAPGGKSMRLAGAVLDALDDGGRIVHLYGASVAPCIDCGHCATHMECIFQDDMVEYGARLAAADVVLVVSPLHFVSLTAPVVAFYSRLQPLWQARRRGAGGPSRCRVGGLVLTGGSSYRNMFEPARAVTAAVFNSIGVRFVGMATAADTDTVPIAENVEALAAARKLGEALREAVTHT